ncbi:unnamed protein product [Spirodela intermedia]|uniref:Uncharacterized protein n=1 Tax=Spirodela intermedia TaxID=51605 RepID=A0A7I8ILU8_SPIIN|nr:unnamed protein product [Spirodela intermedia]CAA6657941.1 unnamed protein product [Spirodela intermedia]
MDPLCSSFISTAGVTFPHGLRPQSGAKVLPLSPRLRRTSAVLKKDGTAVPTSSSSPTYPGGKEALPALLRKLIEATPASSLADSLRKTFEAIVDTAPDTLPPCQGKNPPALRGGAYLRNGPNPQHFPLGTYHHFDGDGMLHSILLPGGGDGTAPATLCSRYVQTYKYLVEREAGRNVFPTIFSGIHGVDGLARHAAFAARVVTGQTELAAGLGVANTSLAFIGGRVFALEEADLPYAVHLSPSGEVITIGRWDFGGELSTCMTAHPKKDAITDEVFAFRCGVVPPFVTYFRFDAEGKKQPDVPIFSVSQPGFFHDFAITENYALLFDTQIVMQPLQMAFAGAFPLGTDSAKVPRVGILPRYAESDCDIRWFELPGFNPVHIVNAWEEDGGATVVLVAPNMLPMERPLERMELVQCCVEMVRIDLKSGAVSRTPLSSENLDFGVINPNYLGRRNRYAYLGVGDPQPKVGAVVKLDMEKKGGDCVVASRIYGPRRFGGEPVFVPALVEGEGEDDGYLVTYLHDENTRESSFLVMDARSPDLEVVAEVSLPCRVPYGFHGLFVTAEELRSQKGKS